MPGTTPNSNILDALDEIIKSLNDTRSITVNSGSGGCGCTGNGGIYPPVNADTPLDSSSPPPTGYITPDPTQVDGRACKAAVSLYFQTLEIFQVLCRFDVPGLAMMSVASSVGFVISLFAIIGGPALILSSTLGRVAAIVEAFLNPVDLGAIIEAWQANQDEIICALYTAAQNKAIGSQAHDEIWQILADYGLSMVNQVVYSNVFTSELLMILAFDYAGGPLIQQDFDDYVLPEGVDCGDCGEDIVTISEYGGSLATLISGNLVVSGTFQSELGVVFGSEHREMILVSSIPEGTNLLWSLNIVSSGDTLFALSYIDLHGNFQQGPWLAYLPETVEAQILHIVGGSNYPANPIVIEISYEIL